MRACESRSTLPCPALPCPLTLSLPVLLSSALPLAYVTDRLLCRAVPRRRALVVSCRWCYEEHEQAGECERRRKETEKKGDARS